MHFGGAGLCWALPSPRGGLRSDAVTPVSFSPKRDCQPPKLCGSSRPLSPAFLTAFQQQNWPQSPRIVSLSSPPNVRGEDRMETGRSPPWAASVSGSRCPDGRPPGPGKRGEVQGGMAVPPSRSARPRCRCSAASGGSAVRGNLTPAWPGPWALGHGPGKVRSPCSSNCLVVYFIQVP